MLSSTSDSKEENCQENFSMTTPSHAKEQKSEHCFSSLVKAFTSTVTSGNWLLDSGCSRHMSGERVHFKCLRPLKVDVSVKFGDGKW